MPLCLQSIPTPLGDLAAGASERGICFLLFADQPAFPSLRDRVQQALSEPFTAGTSPYLQTLEAQLAAYFAGERLSFEVPLHEIGTAFQQSVWRSLRAIPAGETLSYGRLAKNLGAPDAVRAVAKANGENPMLLLSPCHRVVGAGGALTGYSGGLHRKQWLLEHEQRATGTGQPRLF